MNVSECLMSKTCMYVWLTMLKIIKGNLHNGTRQIVVSV